MHNATQYVKGCGLVNLLRERNGGAFCQLFPIFTPPSPDERLPWWKPSYGAGWLALWMRRRRRARAHLFTLTQNWRESGPPGAMLGWLGARLVECCGLRDHDGPADSARTYDARHIAVIGWIRYDAGLSNKWRISYKLSLRWKLWIFLLLLFPNSEC